MQRDLAVCFSLHQMSWTTDILLRTIQNEAVFFDFSYFSVFEKLEIAIAKSKVRERCRTILQYDALIRLVHFGQDRRVCSACYRDLQFTEHGKIGRIGKIGQRARSF